MISEVEIPHSLQIQNLAAAFTDASLKLIVAAKKEEGNIRAKSLIPAIFCAKHASELYIKSILEEFDLNQEGHNQRFLLKKAFSMLKKKYFIKTFQNHLDSFENLVIKYHKNTIGGVKLRVGKDDGNLAFRYIDENTEWAKNLHNVDINLFEKEVKDFSRMGSVLIQIAQMS